MVERPQGETDGDVRVAALRQRRQRLSQIGAVHRHIVDFDRDAALIVAEALERGGEAVDVAARAGDQAIGADGSRVAQRLQIGRGIEGIVHVIVPHRGNLDPVGLWIGGPCEGSESRNGKQEREYGLVHSY